MMSTPSPAQILAALAMAENELSSLVGPAWSGIETQYRTQHIQLESAAGPAQMLAAASWCSSLHLMLPHVIG